MSAKILIGDSREVLKTLPEKSVQCAVTSPPYFGLRDYQTASWDGGDPSCDHAPERQPRTACERSGQPGSLTYNDSRDMPFKDVCGKCGATRQDSQIGLEPTVDEYVAALVDVFREVRRVLKDDGTLWLNLGDSYASSGTSGHQRLDKLGERMGTGGGKKHTSMLAGRAPTPDGLKPKDLIGIPWRVAFALQADGWYLRSEIIWHKQNPMPESVTDRPTKAHEQIFLLSKAPRYYYNAAAIAEPTEYPVGGSHTDAPQGAFRDKGKIPGSGQRSFRAIRDTRNKRSVWTVATAGYNGGHFAVFPAKLVEPCILAGSREGDTVLDPFAGSGTTGMVADRLGRHSILIDLNPANVELARCRIEGDAPLFAKVEIA